MKIENQVCTIEQAKKLKELGVAQESYFSWEYLTKQYGKKSAFPLLSNLKYKPNPGGNHNWVSAFTVAELTQMLPDYYPSWRFEVTTGGPKKWVATVICSPKPPGIDDIHTASEFDRHGDTQAEALATLLIALLETGAVTSGEINQRLLTT